MKKAIILLSVLIIIFSGYFIYKRNIAQEKIIRIKKQVMEKQEQYQLKINKDSIELEKRKEMLLRKRDSLKVKIETKATT